MRVKIPLFALLIVSVTFLSSCTYEQPATEPQNTPLIFVVDGSTETQLQIPTISQTQTFVVGEENPLEWFKKTGKARHNLNVIRFVDEDNDELEEFEIKTRLRNVVRSFDDEVIIGFDKELDNPEFRDVDSVY